MSDSTNTPKPSRVVRGALRSIAERSTEPARRADARVGLTHAEIAERIARETEAAIEDLRTEFLAAYADGVLTPTESVGIKRRIEAARECLRRM